MAIAVRPPATQSLATQSRATQSLVGTIHWCLRHPSIVACELAWRWIFGIPALFLIVQSLLHIATLIPPETVAQLQAAIYDPVQASALLVTLVDLLLPPVDALARWLVPSLLLTWAVVSGIGRWQVLRRIAAQRADLLPAAPATRQAAQLVVFQAIRIAGLSVAVAVGYFCIHTAAGIAFADAQEPNLVFYCAAIIVSVLAIFTVWALLSWAVTLAPLLLVRQGTGLAAAIRAGVAPGLALTGKLVEINLVLGIVKLAMLVLAMVFSAIPLPFASAMTPHQLHVWWLVVSIVYLAVNGFFQIVRLVATLELITVNRDITPTLAAT